MKTLHDIVSTLDIQTLIGNTQLPILSLCLDSRQVQSGSCFFAIHGEANDGHQFIDKAIKQGAVAVVCQELPKQQSPAVTYIQVRDSSYAVGICADSFYDHPSQKLKLVGITGTNGKTTTVTLLHTLFRELGYKTGLLSTIQNRINDRIIPSTHTTPDAIHLNTLLHEMVTEGCTHAFMEVSSHAIVQHRISGITFTGGIFSNLTHDHLDYHKTFDTYLKAKKQFFDALPKTAFALTNMDDKNGQIMVQNTTARIVTYAVRQLADFHCKVIENTFEGLHLNIHNTDVYIRLIGLFNAYNFVAIYATAFLLGEDAEAILPVISGLSSAAGRFEQVTSPKGVTAIVDYAHTPDALSNVLSTINEIRRGTETLICVVGCGGNRDSAKRPIMARIACENSDKIILTSDNPRREDPQSIIDQMLEGVASQHKSKVVCILNREEAIHTATLLAQMGDILLVAGKGHETYQEINDIRHHFDDKEILNKYLNPQSSK
ncbi:UDP-N-acetylmuramoyl-L-alanyl-D-glutamate--2,6-diaminopimelate ligase [Bacteroidia bacterium]|nr:UDP-N-acetylmuramoyl-L-alanyl-D-glutamate--2,6-diaminopimelate ligase [Bacteroidia bacterium]